MPSGADVKCWHESSYSRDEPASAAVIRTIAAVSNEDPRSMRPLYDAVDPDALDAVCSAAAGRTDRTDVTVEFPYLGHRVRITSDGTVSVSDVG